ncbi:MAG: hypothetical protein ABI972_01175 [Acidobacteriota bacterium]
MDLNLPGSTPGDLFDRTRIRVEEVWKGNLKGTVEMWEEASGYDLRFVIGQSVLVYANRDHQNRLTSGRCGRGGGIAESGSDFAYFYFLKHRPKASTRFFGFVTTDAKEVNASPRVWTDPPHGARFLSLMLEGLDGKHYAETNFYGSFVLDGLAGGEYTMTIYGDDFPLQQRVLKSGIKLSIPAKGFLRREIFLPQELFQKE